jgi:hypothetical protein
MATDYVFAVALFTKRYCYKWRPRKWLSLDVANVIIFISKMAKNVESVVFSFSFSEKKIRLRFPSSSLVVVAPALRDLQVVALAQANPEQI